jgi:hypothetical protein
MANSGYQCCYCAQGVAESGDDPVSIVLRSASDHHASQQLWAHAFCLFRMVKSAPLNLALPEELELLPRELALQSASASEIVLPYAQALEALEVIARAGRRVVGWEGWIRTPDGAVGHGDTAMGLDSLSTLDGQQAIARCRQTIGEAYSAWNKSAAHPGTDLLFNITVASA